MSDDCISKSVMWMMIMLLEMARYNLVSGTAFQHAMLLPSIELCLRMMDVRMSAREKSTVVLTTDCGSPLAVFRCLQFN